MKSYPADRFRRIDILASRKLGLPSCVLMENAGRGLADEIRKAYPSVRTPLVICGPGNNGGDGFVAARHLLIRGLRPKVFLMGDPARLPPDAGKNFLILHKCGLRVPVLRKTDPAFRRAVKASDLIIDALFGVGLDREVRDPAREIIQFMNSSGKRIVAVDVPSGLNATSGRIMGDCVRADLTVTFTAPKRGFTMQDGPRQTGKIVVTDIGIPLSSLGKVK